jgi:hypothetical protein
MRALDPFCHDEERKIVIAEDGDGTALQSLDEPHDGERLWPTVDEIADKPQDVACRVERNPIQQPKQLVMAALHVADGVDAHRMAAYVIRITSKKGAAALRLLKNR